MIPGPQERNSEPNSSRIRGSEFQDRGTDLPISRDLCFSEILDRLSIEVAALIEKGIEGVITLQVIATGLDTTMATLLKGL